MSEQFVIARDANNSPLKRVIVQDAGALLYLAHPDFLHAVESGDSYPIGFPEKHVYLFENDVFSRMDYCFNRGEKISEALWGSLGPYRALKLGSK